MTDAPNLPAWLNVSRETLARLQSLCDLVKKWNPAVNLVAKSTVSDIWERHLLDSAQLYALCPATARSWLDLGSGAGFPGLVVAILADQQQPDLHITLVESDKRKSVFLSEAARTLDLKVSVICERIEKVAPQRADVVSARALSSLTNLCAMAKVHMLPQGIAIFPKGANADVEIAEARQKWVYDLSIHPSQTDSAASVLIVKDLRHA